jgi:DNA-binding MarR family transcriptional regulator
VADNRPPHELIPGSPVDVGTQFFALTHSLKRIVNARYRAAGMSMARLQVLHTLVSEGAVRIGELSEHLDVAARTMTSTVEGLARDGLVVRTTDPTDGRAVLVALTRRGEAVFEKAAELRNEVFEEVFAALADDERARFLAMLRTLAEESGIPCPDIATASAAAPAPRAN